MILKARLEAQGATLFRWRGFLPLAVIPLAIVAGLTSRTFADGPADLRARIYDLCCILISFMGSAMRGYIVATAAPKTSGRNMRKQRADSLNVTGAYSVVRNPLYLANFIIFLGMLLFIKQPWLIITATLAYVLYYERIVLTEEAFLLDKFGTAYSDWAESTPAMIPNFRNWIRPCDRFSIKRLLRRNTADFTLSF